MKTTLTYVADTKAFMDEVRERYPELIKYDEQGNEDGVSIRHLALRRNEQGNTLTYSLLTQKQYDMIVGDTLEDGTVIEPLTTIEVLGDYDAMFADAEAHEKYKSVYPYHVPLTYMDEDDVEQKYYMPKQLGVFA